MCTQYIPITVASGLNGIPCNIINNHMNYYTEEVLRGKSETLQWRHNERDGVSKKPASRLLVQPFVQAQIKKNIKAVCHWPLWGESTGDPLKGPVTRKMFPCDDVMIHWPCELHHFLCVFFFFIVEYVSVFLIFWPQRYSEYVTSIFLNRRHIWHLYA